MPDTITKLTDRTFQHGKNYFGLAHKYLSTQIISLVTPQLQKKFRLIPPELLFKIQARLNQ